MKRLFSALLATVFAFSSFTLSASALESKHIKNADTSAVVEYQYVPSHFNKDAVGSIDDVIFENVADASTIAAPYSAEEPMPVLSRTYSSTSKSYLSREVWIEDTTEYLETFYGQSVSNVSEDENYITFYFSSNNSSDKAERYLNKPALELSKESVPNINGEILKVEYLKPESSLASSTLSTKIVYMWGWSDGLIRVDSSPDAGVAFNSASSIALAYFGKQLGTLRSIVLTCFQLTASDFISLYGETRLVRGETYENCYYQNKIACAYVNGNWLPGCEIGSRRLFHGSLAGYKTNAGQWIMDKWTQPQVGRPENNPTNYNDIQKKNHFDDNQWMMNRAIEYYTTVDAEKYIDIFANVYNTL